MQLKHLCVLNAVQHDTNGMGSVILQNNLDVCLKTKILNAVTLSPPMFDMFKAYAFKRVKWKCFFFFQDKGLGFI